MRVRLLSTAPPLCDPEVVALAAAPVPPTAAPTPAAPLLPEGIVLGSGAEYPDLSLVGPSFLDAGFPTYSPLLWTQYGLMKGLEAIHVFGGMEWWGAIVAGSVGLRVGTFFLFFVRSTRMGAWMQHYSETLASFTDRLTAQKSAGDKEGANATMKEYFAFMAAKDLSLVKNLLFPAVAQLVVFGSFFTGLRKLSAEAHLVPGLATQEAVSGSWLLALHLPDPTFVLPIATSVLTVVAIVANPNMAGIPSADLTPGGQKVVFGGLATVFNAISCYFPSVRPSRPMILLLLSRAL
jgi:membrane protein insertase Oxa1/YidC/SpoIIIJ